MEHHRKKFQMAMIHSQKKKISIGPSTEKLMAERVYQGKTISRVQWSKITQSNISICQ